jgi:microcystin-dependent protein
MATSFPGSLDTYVNPTGSDQLSTGPSGGVSHATMHSNVHDALSALQAKVGVDSSAVTSSLDYRMAQAEKNAPVGTVSMFAGAAAPTGWLLCQGQTVNYADYPLLAAVFGVSGGTFTLPDLRQRVPVGSGTGYTLRGSGGSATDSITLAETNLPGHTHGVNHSHTIADHNHGMGNHNHTIPDHNHTIPNHNHTIPNHNHTIPDHNHGMPNHSHTIPNHNHTIPDHDHGISDPGHAHNMPLVNNGTFGGYAGEGHGGTTVPGPDTYSATTGISVNSKTGFSTDSKIGFSTDDKTDYVTNDKTGFSTDSKTGLSTDDKTSLSTDNKAGLSTDDKTGYSTDSKTGLSTSGPASVTSASTGGGTAFDVDVVQPYFVLNFMIRVDD